MNSGAEAVETAIKVARKWGYEVKGVPDGQAEIIVCADNFHGRTVGHRRLLHRPAVARRLRPLRAGLQGRPLRRRRRRWRRPSRPNTVAFLVEPIQGEAGVIIPPAGYLKRARELCTRHNVILILDEIQTGLGRTGKLLAEEHEGIEADLTLIGKALSRRLLSGLGGALELRGDGRAAARASTASTFGGNPLACAVARAALKVLVEEGMVENAATRRRPTCWSASLASIRADSVKEVRGRGLMLAVELHPEAGGARRVCEALQARGLLAKETHDHTIRIAPPLVITRDEIDWAMERIEAVLTE